MIPILQIENFNREVKHILQGHTAISSEAEI